MKKTCNTPAGLVVSARAKALSDQINSLLQAHREREAFEILKDKGNRICYLQPDHHMANGMRRLVESDFN